MGIFSREPRPIQKYEINDKNRTLRIVLIVVFLVIAAVSLTYGFMALLGADPGWQSVQATSQERNCSSSFVFQYDFGSGGAEATAISQNVSAIYSEATVKGYWLFTPDEGSDSYNNIYYINHHPNQVITVDPLLYSAFEKLEAADSRYLYLGPAYAQYNNLFFHEDGDWVLEEDPAVNEENREYLAAIAAFAGDEAAIQVQLLGNNQIKLFVSQAYLAFAQDNEIDCFLDFHYMANAFIIDYIADELIRQGYTQGFLSSIDGYTRNLGGSKENFKLNLFDLQDSSIYNIGAINYQGAASIVSVRRFPVNSSETYYRKGANQTILHPYLSLEDGMCHTGEKSLLLYGYNASCADILLQMQPLFISGSFPEEALQALAKDGLYSIWQENTTICWNDPAVTITNLLQDDGLTYTAEFKK